MTGARPSSQGRTSSRVRAVIALLSCIVAAEVALLVVGSSALRDSGQSGATARPRIPGTAAPLSIGSAPGSTPLPMKATAIGDSVMLAAVDALRADFRELDADAVVGRDVESGIQALRLRAGRGTLGELVVIGLGNNGKFTDPQFETIMALAGTRRVVFVTVRVAQPWEGPNNATIVAGAKRHPNVVVADWHAVAAANPGLLWDDGVHLRPAGVVAYEGLVLSAAQR